MQYKIQNLSHKTVGETQKVVYYVSFLVTHVDDGHNASHHGAVELDPPSEEYEFIPFEQLTEETVVGWVQAKLGEAECSRIEQELARQINESKALVANNNASSAPPWTAAE